MSPELKNMGVGFSVEAAPAQFEAACLSVEKATSVKMGKIAGFAVDKLIDLAQKTGSTWYLRGILIDYDERKDGNNHQTAHLVFSPQSPERERELIEKYTSAQEEYFMSTYEEEGNEGNEGAFQEEKIPCGWDTNTIAKENTSEQSEADAAEIEEDLLEKPDFIRYALGGKDYNSFYPVWVPTQERTKYYKPEKEGRCRVTLRIDRQVVFWGGQVGAKEYTNQCNVLRAASDSKIDLIDQKGRLDHQGMFWFSEGGYGSEDKEDPSLAITRELIADDLMNGVEWMVEGPQIADSLITAFISAGASL